MQKCTKGLKQVGNKKSARKHQCNPTQLASSFLKGTVILFYTLQFISTSYANWTTEVLFFGSNLDYESKIKNVALEKKMLLLVSTTLWLANLHWIWNNSATQISQWHPYKTPVEDTHDAMHPSAKS